MKRALSLVELMIVLAVLGILAAIVIPQFQSHTTEAKETVAKEHLRILRGAIELYTAQHSGVPPGYKDNVAGSTASSTYFYQQIVLSGSFFRKMPKNPFNNLDTMSIIGDGQTFPSEATGKFGWIYQPSTMTIRLDWTGKDNDGMRYFDY
jgi:general secretion pathway protein G